MGGGYSPPPPPPLATLLVGAGMGSKPFGTKLLSITAKQDKTQCTTATKQLFGQSQSDDVHSLLMLACYHGATATAPNVNFLIVK